MSNAYVNATTMMEHWDTPEENSSHNHAWLNSVAYFFRARLGGIVLDRVGAAHEVLVRPWPLGRGQLAWVRAAAPTPHGLVRSAWELRAGALELQVAVPPALSAVVDVPVANGTALVAACAQATAQPGTALVIGDRLWRRFSLPSDTACNFSSPNLI